jgi:hypothetical protein
VDPLRGADIAAAVSSSCAFGSVELSSDGDTYVSCSSCAPAVSGGSGSGGGGGEKEGGAMDHTLMFEYASDVVQRAAVVRVKKGRKKSKS